GQGGAPSPVHRRGPPRGTAPGPEGSAGASGRRVPVAILPIRPAGVASVSGRLLTVATARPAPIDTRWHRAGGPGRVGSQERQQAAGRDPPSAGAGRLRARLPRRGATDGGRMSVKAEVKRR